MGATLLTVDGWRMGATLLTVDGWRMKEVRWFQRTMCRMSVGICRCELQEGVGSGIEHDGIDGTAAGGAFAAGREEAGVGVGVDAGD